MLALDGSARAWEPKRPRLRLLSAAGRLTRGGRQTRMRIAPVAGAGAGHRRGVDAVYPKSNLSITKS